MSLLSGLAPYAVSYPSLASRPFALSVRVSSTFFSLSSLLRRSTCISTIDFICSLDNGWNIIISSILFKNSGLKETLRLSITLFLISSYSLSPSPVRNWLPILDVIIITVFLKSTVRPWPSVSLPSSSI